MGNYLKKRFLISFTLALMFFLVASFSFAGGITATYVDADTFTIETDRTTEFSVNRRIKANCGTDGYKYGTILSSSYSSPDTTVNLTTRSDDLTSNLIEVWYGIISEGLTGSVPDHTHDGLEGSGGSLSESVFYADSTETDQGAAGNALTIKTFVDAIGSDTATIYLRHNSGSATTTYTLTTSETTPDNITLEIEPGAIIDGAGTLTAESPDHIKAGKKQRIFGSSITVLFSKSGTSYPKWHGAVGNGTTDDTAAFQASIDSLDNGGGGIVSFNERHLIDSNLIIYEGIELRGELVHPGVPGTNNPDTANIWDYNSRLVINSSATITIEGGSSITHCFAIRKGMTGPENSATAYAGTAFTVNGEDVFLNHCLIIGFNKLVYSNGNQRIRIKEILGDGVYGFDILLSYDIVRISDCHLWPFGTIAASSPVTTFDDTHYLFRKGWAYSLRTVSDWTKITNCFSYGYLRGFNLEDVSSVTLIGCGADNISQVGSPYVVADTIGFNIDADNILISACQSAANSSAYRMSGTGVDRTAQIIGCSAWWANSGVYAVGVDPTIIGCRFKSIGSGVTYGIRMNDADIDATIIGNTLIDFSAAIDGGSSGKHFYRDNRIINSGTIDNTILPAVASAATIALPDRGDVVEITGTTNITSVTSSYAGRTVALKFAAILTFTDGSNLKLAGDFVTTADDIITIVCDGTNWYETSRSAN